MLQRRGGGVIGKDRRLERALAGCVMVHCGRPGWPRGRQEQGMYVGWKHQVKGAGVKMNNSAQVGLSETQMGPFHSFIK